MKQLLAQPRIEQQFLIEPQLLAKGGTMAIYGRPGTLKSWLSLDAAYALATGGDWLAYPCVRSTVVIMQAEVPEHSYIERLHAYTKNMNGSVPDNLYMDNDLTMKISDFNGLTILNQVMEECHPHVIIFDNLYQIVSGTVSSEVDLKKILDNIDKIRQAYGTAFIFIHHPRKDQSTDDDSVNKGFEEMLTSSIFGNWLDTIIKVTSVPPNQDQPDTIRLDFQKVKEARNVVHPIQVKFNKNNARFYLD